MTQTSEPQFKVILTFHLKSGLADEELRRSRQEYSFPHMLARQPGCISIELVKVSEDQTLSVQTWASQRAWWSALEAVKNARETGQSEDVPTDEILESRDFVGGTVVAVVR